MEGALVNQHLGEAESFWFMKTMRGIPGNYRVKKFVRPPEGAVTHAGRELANHVERLPCGCSSTPPARRR